MSYKLLVLDIDGTVTNSKKEITPKTKEAILELQKKGIPVDCIGSSDKGNCGSCR